MANVRLMQAESCQRTEKDASTILTNKGIIFPTASDRLGASMRRRLPAGEVLARNMKEAGGISAPELVRRAEAKGYTISRNTINYILRGETKNPGVFTIEAIAVALEKAPEQLAAEFLGVRADDPSFKASQFAMLSELYKGLSPSQKPKADHHIETLLVMLQHIKNQ